MHCSTIVLLPPETRDLYKAGTELLEPHRLIENADPRPPWRLDYWCAGGENIADEQTALQYGLADSDLARNVCLVTRLPSDYIPGAIVTPDGKWYDLLDHGFRMVDEDSPGNREALARWAQQAKELLGKHSGCVAIEFDTHS